MSNDNENDQRSEPYKGNDELLPTSAVHHIDDDFRCIDDQQQKNQNPVNPKKSAWNVINRLESGVVIVDQTGV